MLPKSKIKNQNQISVSFPKEAVRKNGWHAAKVTFDKDKISVELCLRLPVGNGSRNNVAVRGVRWLKGYSPHRAALQVARFE